MTMHHIQYCILDLLIKNQTVRFSALKPKSVESNLFQYHLNKLIRDGYVEKVEGGYSLSVAGLNYADNHSASLKQTRLQPKIISILRVFNAEGHILLTKKATQPFIGTFHLPAGKVHEDESMFGAARRELFEKTGLNIEKLYYKSLIHGVVRLDGAIISEYYAHLFDTVIAQDYESTWYSPLSSEIELAPLVKDILAVPNNNPSAYYEFSEYINSVREYAQLDDFIKAIETSPPDKTTIITLGGPTACGKSTLIQDIKIKYGDACTVIETDNYYIGKKRMQKEMPIGEEDNFDHPGSIDIDRLVQDLESLKNGKPISCPVYDMFLSEPTGTTTQIKPTPLIIVEGIIANSPKIRRSASITASLSIPAEERLRRRIARDITRNGQDSEQVRRLFNKLIEPAYQKYYATDDLSADYIIRPL